MGGELQDHFHAFHKDVVQVVDALNDTLIFGSAHQKHRKADEQCHDDDLQHFGIHHGGDKVGRKDVDQCVHKGGGFGGLVGKVGGGYHREQTLKQGAADQADGDGEGGGAQIVDHGFDADGAHLPDVAHGDDAAHDGKQHDGYHDEFEQVQEDGAEGLNIVLGKVRMVLEQQTGDDGQHQRNKDLRSQGQFLFFLS